ncbi:hypothetical protein DIPPA_33626 [Diplonema papillatum]|nr:hypothetical protein DIPPA_33626 [Diplonema papillatum]
MGCCVGKNDHIVVDTDRIRPRRRATSVSMAFLVYAAALRRDEDAARCDVEADEARCRRRCRAAAGDAARGAVESAEASGREETLRESWAHRDGIARQAQLSSGVAALREGAARAGIAGEERAARLWLVHAVPRAELHQQLLQQQLPLLLLEHFRACAAEAHRLAARVLLAEALHTLTVARQRHVIAFHVFSAAPRLHPPWSPRASAEQPLPPLSPPTSPPGGQPILGSPTRANRCEPADEDTASVHVPCSARDSDAACPGPPPGGGSQSDSAAGPAGGVLCGMFPGEFAASPRSLPPSTAEVAALGFYAWSPVAASEREHGMLFALLAVGGSKPGTSLLVSSAQRGIACMPDIPTMRAVYGNLLFVRLRVRRWCRRRKLVLLQRFLRGLCSRRAAAVKRLHGALRAACERSAAAFSAGCRDPRVDTVFDHLARAPLIIAIRQLIVRYQPPACDRPHAFEREARENGRGTPPARASRSPQPKAGGSTVAGARNAAPSGRDAPEGCGPDSPFAAEVPDPPLAQGSAPSGRDAPPVDRGLAPPFAADASTVAVARGSAPSERAAHSPFAANASTVAELPWPLAQGSAPPEDCIPASPFAANASVVAGVAQGSAPEGRSPVPAAPSAAAAARAIQLCFRRRLAREAVYGRRSAWLAGVLGGGWAARVCARARWVGRALGWARRARRSIGEGRLKTAAGTAVQRWWRAARRARALRCVAAAAGAARVAAAKAEAGERAALCRWLARKAVGDSRRLSTEALREDVLKAAEAAAARLQALRQGRRDQDRDREAEARRRREAEAEGDLAYDGALAELQEEQARITRAVRRASLAASESEERRRQFAEAFTAVPAADVPAHRASILCSALPTAGPVRRESVALAVELGVYQKRKSAPAPPAVDGAGVSPPSAEEHSGPPPPGGRSSLLLRPPSSRLRASLPAVAQASRGSLPPVVRRNSSQAAAPRSEVPSRPPPDAAGPAGGDAASAVFCCVNGLKGVWYEGGGAGETPMADVVFTTSAAPRLQEGITCSVASQLVAVHAPGSSPSALHESPLAAVRSGLPLAGHPAYPSAAPGAGVDPGPPSALHVFSVAERRFLEPVSVTRWHALWATVLCFPLRGRGAAAAYYSPATNEFGIAVFATDLLSLREVARRTLAAAPRAAGSDSPPGGLAPRALQTQDFNPPGGQAQRALYTLDIAPHGGEATRALQTQGLIPSGGPAERALHSQDITPPGVSGGGVPAVETRCCERTGGQQRAVVDEGEPPPEPRGLRRGSGAAGSSAGGRRPLPRIGSGAARAEPGGDASHALRLPRIGGALETPPHSPVAGSLAGASRGSVARDAHGTPRLSQGHALPARLSRMSISDSSPAAPLPGVSAGPPEFQTGGRRRHSALPRIGDGRGPLLYGGGLDGGSHLFALSHPDTAEVTFLAASLGPRGRVEVTECSRVPLGISEVVLSLALAVVANASAARLPLLVACTPSGAAVLLASLGGDSPAVRVLARLPGEYCKATVVDPGGGTPTHRPPALRLLCTKISGEAVLLRVPWGPAGHGAVRAGKTTALGVPIQTSEADVQLLAERCTSESLGWTSRVVGVAVAVLAGGPLSRRKAPATPDEEEEEFGAFKSLATPEPNMALLRPALHLPTGNPIAATDEGFGAFRLASLGPDAPVLRQTLERRSSEGHPRMSSDSPTTAAAQSAFLETDASSDLPPAASSAPHTEARPGGSEAPPHPQRLTDTGPPAPKTIAKHTTDKPASPCHLQSSLHSLRLAGDGVRMPESTPNFPTSGGPSNVAPEPAGDASPNPVHLTGPKSNVGESNVGPTPESTPKLPTSGGMSIVAPSPVDDASPNPAHYSLLAFRLAAGPESDVDPTPESTSNLPTCGGASIVAPSPVDDAFPNPAHDSLLAFRLALSNVDPTPESTANLPTSRAPPEAAADALPDLLLPPAAAGGATAGLFRPTAPLRASGIAWFADRPVSESFLKQFRPVAPPLPPGDDLGAPLDSPRCGRGGGGGSPRAALFGQSQLSPRRGAASPRAGGGARAALLPTIRRQEPPAAEERPRAQSDAGLPSDFVGGGRAGSRRATVEPFTAKGARFPPEEAEPRASATVEPLITRGKPGLPPSGSMFLSDEVESHANGSSSSATAEPCITRGIPGLQPSGSMFPSHEAEPQASGAGRSATVEPLITRGLQPSGSRFLSNEAESRARDSSRSATAEPFITRVQPSGSTFLSDEAGTQASGTGRTATVEPFVTQGKPGLQPSGSTFLSDEAESQVSDSSRSATVEPFTTKGKPGLQPIGTAILPDETEPQASDPGGFAAVEPFITQGKPGLQPSGGMFLSSNDSGRSAVEPCAAKSRSGPQPMVNASLSDKADPQAKNDRSAAADPKDNPGLQPLENVSLSDEAGHQASDSARSAAAEPKDNSGLQPSLSREDASLSDKADPPGLQDTPAGPQPAGPAFQFPPGAPGRRAEETALPRVPAHGGGGAAAGGGWCRHLVGHPPGGEGSRRRSSAQQARRSLQRTRLRSSLAAVSKHGRAALVDRRFVDEGQTALVLRDLGLADADVAPLITLVAASKTLVRIDLTGNDLTDTVAMALAPALKYSTSVAHIELRGNKLTSLGAKYFLPALAVNRRMKYLGLDEQRGVGVDSDTMRLVQTGLNR